MNKRYITYVHVFAYMHINNYKTYSVYIHSPREQKDTLSFPLAQRSRTWAPNHMMLPSPRRPADVSWWRRQVHLMAPLWRPKSWWRIPLRTSQLAHQQYEQLSPTQDQLPKLWISNVFWLDNIFNIWFWLYIWLGGTVSTEKSCCPD